MKLCECGCGYPAPIATKNNTQRGYVKGEPYSFIYNHHPKRGSPPGSSHPLWKGDKITYKGLHQWLARTITKTGTCTKCFRYVGTERGKGTEWSNISGNYLRIADDYQELCKPCHREFDTAPKRKHGTTSMYRRACRCLLCKTANTEYGRMYRARLR